MAPPPLPPDYGSTNWNNPPAAATTAAPPADDWGWNEQPQNEATPRYSNAPVDDDPWSNPVGGGGSSANDNYNQASLASADPFDNTPDPQVQVRVKTPVQDANTNQVTCRSSQQCLEHQLLLIMYLFSHVPTLKNPVLYLNIYSMTCQVETVNLAPYANSYKNLQ